MPTRSSLVTIATAAAAVSLSGGSSGVSAFNAACPPSTAPQTQVGWLGTTCGCGHGRGARAFAARNSGRSRRLYGGQSRNRCCSVVSYSSTAEANEEMIALNGGSGKLDVNSAEVNGNAPADFPVQGEGGIWQIENAEQHAAFLAAHPKELVVIKFYAPWCRACKALGPKYMQVAKDATYKDLPIVFAELNVKHNKEFVKSLGILALPSMHFYAGADGLVENFPCGPSKIQTLRRKLASFINENVDTNTRELILKNGVIDGLVETEPCKKRPVTQEESSTDVMKQGEEDRVKVTNEQIHVMRTTVPYFRDLSDLEFKRLLSQATLETFEPGSIIMRQGMEGKSFYFITSGEVEICVKMAFEDPLTTPASYLGSVINRFSTHDFFGERALITGEPRAASIRAVEKTRCIVLQQEDIPATSVLSGKIAPTAGRLKRLDDKYAVNDVDSLEEQLRSVSIASQSRGSPNTPEKISGVDSDSDDESIDSTIAEERGRVLPGTAYPRDNVLPLLVRFKLIQKAARCFEHISRTRPHWGDQGEIARRSFLVSHLTAAQRAEIEDVFRLIDRSNDGVISVVELKNALETVGGERTEEELKDMMSKANTGNGGNTISFTEFMGVMAEAEFYYLFTETFNMLDKFNSGFVKAADLDRVLCGMRDMISDDRHSIIDVEDKEMLINYQEFSKMLLGVI